MATNKPKAPKAAQRTRNTRTPHNTGGTAPITPRHNTADERRGHSRKSQRPAGTFDKRTLTHWHSADADGSNGTWHRELSAEEAALPEVVRAAREADARPHLGPEHVDAAYLAAREVPVNYRTPEDTVLTVSRGAVMVRARKADADRRRTAHALAKRARAAQRPPRDSFVPRAAHVDAVTPMPRVNIVRAALDIWESSGRVPGLGVRALRELAARERARHRQHVAWDSQRAAQSRADAALREAKRAARAQRARERAAQREAVTVAAMSAVDSAAQRRSRARGRRRGDKRDW